MSKSILLTIIIAVIAISVGGWWYVTRVDTSLPVVDEANGDVMFSGTVLSVDNSAMMVDGPLQFVITTENDTTETVTVPSMGINLCAASDAVRSAFDVSEGDVVSVRGLRAEDGSILPCDSVDHYVRIVTKLDQAAHSLLDSNVFTGVEAVEMYYQSGPMGYTAVPNQDWPDKAFGRKLYVTADYDSFQAGLMGEAPAGIDVYLFSNPDTLSPEEWIGSENNPFANLMIANDTSVPRSIAGRTFYEYRRDGLYQAKIYVTSVGTELLLVAAEFIAETDRTQIDALRMLETLRSGQIEVN